MTRTTCSKCEAPLEPQRMNKQSYCLACQAEYMRQTRPHHRELNPEARKKANVRAYTKVYVRRGKIVKSDTCEICGQPHTEAHHEDYNRPLEVNWLCRKCHLELHQGKIVLESAKDIIGRAELQQTG